MNCLNLYEEERFSLYALGKYTFSNFKISLDLRSTHLMNIKGINKENVSLNMLIKNRAINKALN